MVVYPGVTLTGQVHQLKTWPWYFEQVIMERKPFEWRRDDQGYQTGDVLVLKEWDPDNEQYTGRSSTQVVTCIVRGPAFDITPGYCIMGIALSPSAWVVLAAVGKV